MVAVLFAANPVSVEAPLIKPLPSTPGPPAALAAGVNAGASTLYNIALVDNSSPPKSLDDIGLQPFTTSTVPEPSTFALAGLGAAAMLIFRRRK